MIEVGESLLELVHSLNTSGNSLLHLARTEAYCFAISDWRRYQVPVCIEDNFELVIVLAFKLVQTARHFGVGN